MSRVLSIMLVLGVIALIAGIIALLFVTPPSSEPLTSTPATPSGKRPGSSAIGHGGPTPPDSPRRDPARDVPLEQR